MSDMSRVCSGSRWHWDLRHTRSVHQPERLHYKGKGLALCVLTLSLPPALWGDPTVFLTVNLWLSRALHNLTMSFWLFSFGFHLPSTTSPCLFDCLPLAFTCPPQLHHVFLTVYLWLSPALHNFTMSFWLFTFGFHLPSTTSPCLFDCLALAFTCPPQLHHVFLTVYLWLSPALHNFTMSFSRLFPDASLVTASARESRSATQVAPLEISDSWAVRPRTCCCCCQQ